MSRPRAPFLALRRWLAVAALALVAGPAHPGAWMTATARVLFARDEADPITDLQGLVGLRPAEGWMTMLAASRYADAKGVYCKIPPSAGYELRDRLWIVPGLSQELTKDRSTGVGLALWFSF